ncbi:hypothetical protein [Glaciimonas sp. PCH181]|uniref:hypothetical protein n=1 Tax=Glaciimonas sp. PCH181 TaxID=2133943 RepID=UPI000D363547|nr:hypothetical protein [Glaciimonas sp. PCH181]PUA16775.1 hypothetical protein C7W93_22585 [Glaciimonas sp. PCH181]
MKKNLDGLILTLILSCSNTAWGATVMPELKKANTEICIKMGRSAQGAPKNEAKMPAFCNCVTDTYWDSVPQAEYNLLTASGKSPSLEANMEKRLNLAKAICLKKAG